MEAGCTKSPILQLALRLLSFFLFRSNPEFIDSLLAFWYTAQHISLSVNKAKWLDLLEFPRFRQVYRHPNFPNRRGNNDRREPVVSSLPSSVFYSKRSQLWSLQRKLIDQLYLGLTKDSSGLMLSMKRNGISMYICIVPTTQALKNNLIVDHIIIEYVHCGLELHILLIYLVTSVPKSFILCQLITSFCYGGPGVNGPLTSKSTHHSSLTL